MNPSMAQNLTGRQQRPLRSVPRIIWIILITGLALQILWHSRQAETILQPKPLPSPPSQAAIQFISLDDPITAGKLLMLWLQTFDNQAGLSIPLKQLNYDRLVEWLDLILRLDPHSQYPLLAAARLYTYHPAPEKKRQMLEFIHRKFLEDPARRWKSMAHAVLLARHQLKDMEYAHQLAQSLRERSPHDSVPDWARQMEIFILEAKGEYKAAQILIGGLLASGELEDPQERRFLEKKLLEIRQAERAAPE